jgi:hypothetical protein
VDPKRRSATLSRLAHNLIATSADGLISSYGYVNCVTRDQGGRSLWHRVTKSSHWHLERDARRWRRFGQCLTRSESVSFDASRRDINLGESPRRSALTELNRLIKDNRVAEYSSPNLVLGMRPVGFATGTSRWLWEQQPPTVLNPFGTVQGGYLAVLIDEMLLFDVLFDHHRIVLQTEGLLEGQPAPEDNDE